MIKTISLTKGLVAIPSYVGPSCDESKVGTFIYNYLGQFPWLTVKKQFVTKTRFNIVAIDKSPTELLFCGHIDTVEPKGKWVAPKIQSGKLYGLGSSDMKGTIATMLAAVSEAGPTKGVAWLFYVDEEYDFLGMKRFIADYRNRLAPKLVVGEGSDNQIRNGCRGLIEIKFTVTGITGHASRPELGKNAIIGAQKIFAGIQDQVAKCVDRRVGSSSINLASINGGLDLGDSQIGRQGNNIANYCEFIIDIRTANKTLRANDLVRLATQIARQNKLGLTSAVRHDKLGWFSATLALPKLILAKYPVCTDFRSGYVDTQMLNEAFGCPCFGFGCGLGDQAHKKGEFIPVKNLTTGQQFYLDLITRWKGGENDDTQL
ncbi:M20/M25/M40 family metallo-hydrolase [Candidatus Microgenomates bacterium]|nr:M20/M25/M40 family metallo-hydrolase [Candidatus Microgenomates bacterium]